MAVGVRHRSPGIGQLHITVSDLETSVAFYRDVLGLPHLFTVEGQPMAFFQAGAVRLYLGDTGRAVPVPAGGLLRGRRP